MTQYETSIRKSSNRRKFLKTGIAAGAVTMGAGLLSGGLPAIAQNGNDNGDLTKGDIAILRFLNAVEQIEADLWTQYSELGGTQDNEVSGTNGGNPLYTAALAILDGDMAQYIHDNTDDEMKFLAPTEATHSTQPLSPFLTVTWPSTSMTTPTMKTVT